MLQNQFNQTNYNHYSGFVQLSLPFDLSVKIDSNDPVFSFLEAVEGIDFQSLLRLPAQIIHIHTIESCCSRPFCLLFRKAIVH